MTATAGSPIVSFPSSIFAALSPAQYLRAHLSSSTANPSPIRPNGRSVAEFRVPAINSSSLTHCNGSAVVRLGDTAVVCGVRGEILNAGDVTDDRSIQLVESRFKSEATDEEELDLEAAEIDALHLLVPNIELATGCNACHLPGNPPSAFAQTLAQRTLNLLRSTRVVRAQDLRILVKRTFNSEDEDLLDESPRTEVKAYWTLYIDILFMSLDGSAFDAAWCAVLAALKDTKLPHAQWDAESEMILCSDSVADARTLNLRHLPVPATFAVFSPPVMDGLPPNSWVLADPDASEEELCNETICLVVDCSFGESSKIMRIEKSGGCVIDKQGMRDAALQAKTRWKQWNEVLSR